MDRNYNRVPTERIEPDNVQQIRRVIRTDGKRRVFGYAMLSETNGACDEDDEENQAAFERGEDQVAYDRLMAHVHANAAKGLENPLEK